LQECAHFVSGIDCVLNEQPSREFHFGSTFVVLFPSHDILTAECISCVIFSVADMKDAVESTGDVNSASTDFDQWKKNSLYLE
jgi:hypothetical protein